MTGRSKRRQEGLSTTMKPAAGAPSVHRLGVSLRRLQKGAERGETIMARLWDEPLNRAAGLLIVPDAAKRTITDIAFRCGRRAGASRDP